MKINSKLFLILVIVVGMIVAWKIAFLSGTWRYKMTVIVDTPEGIRTGSAVREIKIAKGIEFTPESSPHVEVKGEAVIVDLGTRGILFALMRSDNLGPDYSYQIFFKAFPHEFGGMTTKGIEYYSSLKNRKVSLKAPDYPTIVKFEDKNHLSSMKVINPANFEKYYGPGVKIHDVVIETTDEPITSQIDKFLPLGDGKPHLFDLSNYRKK